jgi:ArsR family transcriptional regulator
VEDTVQQQVRVLKALASEPRLQIMRLLCEHPQCVNSLTARLEMTQPAVSQHLHLLRDAGLIKAEKRGVWTHYSPNEEIIERHSKEMAGIFGGWVEVGKPVDGTHGCPPALLQECQPPSALAAGEGGA